MVTVIHFTTDMENDYVMIHGDDKFKGHGVQLFIKEVKGNDGKRFARDLANLIGCDLEEAYPRHNGTA